MAWFFFVFFFAFFFFGGGGVGGGGYGYSQGGYQIKLVINGSNLQTIITLLNITKVNCISRSPCGFQILMLTFTSS